MLFGSFVMRKTGGCENEVKQEVQMQKGSKTKSNEVKRR